MFAPGDFEPPPPPNVPFQDNRRVGAFILFFALLLCLALVLLTDSYVLGPYSATRSVTQTYMATVSGTPVSNKTTTPIVPVIPTHPTPGRFDLKAEMFPQPKLRVQLQPLTR